MHEVSVVSNFVIAILDELEKYDVERVEEVTLVIGDLTSLGEEQMMFAYEVVTKGTKLEGSKLIVEHEKIEVSCEHCGYKGGVNVIENDFDQHSIPILSCPKCNGNIKVIKGQSCTVRSFKIVEAD